MSVRGNFTVGGFHLNELPVVSFRYLSIMFILSFVHFLSVAVGSHGFPDYILLFLKRQSLSFSQTVCIVVISPI